jgi:hypothetical protein
MWPRASKVLRIAIPALLALAFTGAAWGQQPTHPALDPHQAAELAVRMCRQLENIGTILSYSTASTSNAGSTNGTRRRTLQPPVDDVYDTLLELGRYSLPCLVNRLTDIRWMPDPRSEPLLGIPVIGDVAYMVLTDKGVAELIPALAHRKPDEMRMDEFFIWPSVGDHRQRLQTAVREWLAQHPKCCETDLRDLDDSPSEPAFKMSTSELASARARFSRLRPGMSPEEVLKIAGKPDAIDDGQRPPGNGPPGSPPLGLLGLSGDSRNEDLAYIYFTVRWADKSVPRDPLRDRYVILFFSGEGKFVRMFSNVCEIPPIFPSTAAEWNRVIWGEPAQKH